MDKIIKKVHKTRLNWWDAFKGAISLHGYYYYKPPPELKYRYPAPGSCPLDELDHPNLYKSHWRTPFRDSPYYIQKKEKKLDDDPDFDVVESKNIPKLDENDYYD